MNVRTIPSTNEKIPVVGLGTWQTFDVGQSEAERAPLKEVLKVLIEHGGSVIDSSPMYGRSEQVVGELTTKLNLKPKIFEATKVWISGEDEGIEQINDSMHLMQVDQMDLLQIHNLLDWKTHLKTLRKWKEAQKIRYIGITHYPEFDATSWGQFFLKFILANEAVTCVIPGTSKAKHMRDNVQSGFGKLPTIEHQRKMIELIEL